jgi:hypothetical protein
MLGRTRISVVALLLVVFGLTGLMLVRRAGAQQQQTDPIAANAQQMLADGKSIFRFDTFGDESFWGDTLKLHQAVAGAKLGGVGSGVSPATALAVGLKSGCRRAPTVRDQWPQARQS